MNDIETWVGDDAIEQLSSLLAARGTSRVTVVADENTHAALGASVNAALGSRRDPCDIGRPAR